LGGKGYKPYTSLTGKKVSGDWEDSDRGSGNKAKKRAGGKVEKKSPTYLAHVHNKAKRGVKEGYKGTADLSKADPAAKKKVEDRIAKHFGTKRVPGGKKGVKEEVDAYKYVVAKLKKKHGDGVLTKRDKIKPQSAADKAKARAHQAKVDAENAAERAKDPSQGRYPKG